MTQLSRLVLTGALAAAGCSSRSVVPSPRFADRPAVAAVDDRRDVARPPRARAPVLALYYFDRGFFDLLVDPLGLPRHHRARGVNALDEVPDSTWFTNRIGVAPVSRDVLRRGPSEVASPQAYKPWTITSGMNVVSAHVVLGQGADPAAALDELSRCLADDFDIEHSTFQLETEDRRRLEERSHA